MNFTDDNLKRFKIAMSGGMPDTSIWAKADLELLQALLARLEAAELALEDADCDCKGQNTDKDLVNVCRFYKRKEIWKKAAGK